jgi:hypothetical protein
MNNGEEEEYNSRSHQGYISYIIINPQKEAIMIRIRHFPIPSILTKWTESSFESYTRLEKGRTDLVDRDDTMKTMVDRV